MPITSSKEYPLVLTKESFTHSIFPSLSVMTTLFFVRVAMSDNLFNSISDFEILAICS